MVTIDRREGTGKDLFIHGWQCAKGIRSDGDVLPAWQYSLNFNQDGQLVTDRMEELQAGFLSPWALESHVVNFPLFSGTFFLAWLMCVPGASTSPARRALG